MTSAMISNCVIFWDNLATFLHLTELSAILFQAKVIIVSSFFMKVRPKEIGFQFTQIVIIVLTVLLLRSSILQHLFVISYYAMNNSKLVICRIEQSSIIMI